MASYYQIEQKKRIDLGFCYNDCIYYIEKDYKKLHELGSELVFSPNENTPKAEELAIVIGLTNTNAKSIVVPEFTIYDGKEIKVAVIGSEAFIDSQLEHIEIKANLRKIESRAFLRCRKLQHIMLPNGISFIGEEAFGSCSLLSEIEFPEMLENVQARIFEKCELLKYVYINNKLSYLSTSMFSECKSIEKIVLPQNIKTIQSGCFENCIRLESIYFHKNIECIESLSFAGCKRLTKIRFYGRPVKMGHEAFRGCTKLKDIILPTNEKFPAEIFIGCKKIRKQDRKDLLIESDFSERLEYLYKWESWKKNYGYKLLKFFAIPLRVVSVILFLSMFVIGYVLVSLIGQAVLSVVFSIALISIGVFVMLTIIYFTCNLLFRVKNNSDDIFKYITFISIFIGIIIFIVIGIRHWVELCFSVGSSKCGN
jgi:hypothetical protein